MWMKGVFEILGMRKASMSLSELSGSLGDLGTFLPLLLSLATFGAVEFGAALFWAGWMNLVTGFLWDSPMPVQPMKTIAAVVVASGDPSEPGLTAEETIGAGVSVSVIVLLLGATRCIEIINFLVPRPVVHGLQVGLGASMVQGGLLMNTALSFASEADCILLGVLSAIFVLATSMKRFDGRVPSALILTLVGMVIAFISMPKSEHVRPGFPPFLAVSSITASDIWSGFLKAGLAQLPLTTLNSVVSICDLNNNKLFPNDEKKYVSRTSVASSVGLMNLTSLWFGAMPMCHGAGGLAAQHRFGARSGTAVLLLGVFKIFIAIMLDDGAAILLENFPKSILGILLVFAGLNLAIAGLRDDQPGEDSKKIVLLATAATTLTFRTGWGFFAGMLVSAFNGGFDHVFERIFAKTRENENREDEASSASETEVVPT